MKYNYLVIEGNIGSGKTSLATRISEQFNSKLILEQFADNPFLPKFYNDPDKYAFPLELSFLAERYRQLKEDLSKQDLFKDFTVADYFFNKTLIFAKTTLQKDEFNLFSKLFTIINESLPKPDLFVYLYLDVDKLIKNILNRGRNYEKNIQKEYLQSIQNGYFDFIKNNQHQLKILIIDTNTIDFVNSYEDYKKIVSCIFDNDYKTGINRIKL
ncbi:MAG: Deoxyguanosine kinase [Bacteroidetes bacterium ADurb.Bin408]|nr:MAG: Deoxyguanosine kinase [Bacteroidetes bacterium ADurb.Bin408]